MTHNDTQERASQNSWKRGGLGGQNNVCHIIFL